MNWVSEHITVAGKCHLKTRRRHIPACARHSRRQTVASLISRSDAPRSGAQSIALRRSSSEHAFNRRCRTQRTDQGEIKSLRLKEIARGGSDFLSGNRLEFLPQLFRFDHAAVA